MKIALCLKDDNAFLHAAAAKAKHSFAAEKQRPAIITIEGLGTFIGTVQVDDVVMIYGQSPPGRPVPFEIKASGDLTPSEPAALKPSQSPAGAPSK